MNQEDRFVFQSIAGLPRNQQLKKITNMFCQENANILKSGSGRMSTAENKNDRKAPPLWEELGKDSENR